jgi:hypothetical protein
MGSWLWSAGALTNYAQYNGLAQIKHVARATNLEFGPWPYLVKEGYRNRFFFWTGELCLGYAALRIAMPTTVAVGRRIPTLGRVADHPVFRRFHSALSTPAADTGSSYEHAVPILCCYALFQVATLWINPFPYPYLHVTALPGVALVIAYGILRAVRHWTSIRPWLSYAASVVAIALSLTTSLPRLLDKTVDGTAPQLAFVAQVHAITPEDGTVFDLAGLHFRADPYPVYVMTKIMIERYKQGAFPRMIPFLRENRVATIVANYRTRLLEEDLKSFIRDHFVRYNRYLYVPGAEINNLQAGQSRPFEVLTPRIFRFHGEGDLLVNGTEFVHGMLGKGTYMLSTAAGAVHGRLIVDVPPPTFDDTIPRGQVYHHVFD